MAENPITQAPAERLNFKPLLLGNANYFGTLKNSKLPVVANIQGNTTFEAITCVGFNPELRRIEATVQLTQSTGYLGGLCAPGSQEFVRFFVSFNNGASWSDAGMSAFTAHDITRTQPMVHAVGVSFETHILCLAPNQAFKIRAILSWDNPPPAGDPGFTPVWGNVVEVTARRRPLSFISLPPGIDLPTLLAESNVPPATLCGALTAIEDTSPAGLAKAYASTGVPQHRFLFPQIAAALAQNPDGGAAIAADLANLVPGVNIADLVKLILAPQSDMTYERLDCVGFEAADQMLAAVFTLRRPTGFNGGPCTAGSLEHVGFFIDWHDGLGYQYAGSTAVRVHDHADVPADGIRYEVRVPLDVSQYQQLCTHGPVTGHVRAILSWNTPVPPGNPNFNPVWGNRQEAEIQIEPGQPGISGLVPILSAVGDIPVIHIDGSGLIQNGTAIHTGLTFDDAPFGGQITLAGKIVNGTSATRYRLMRRLVGGGGGFVPLTNEPAGFTLSVVTFDPSTGVQIQDVTLHADAEGYYTYEDYGPTHYVEGNLLGRWFSNLGEDGQTFELRVDVSTDGNPAHDLHSNTVFVKVDNQAPVAKLAINAGAVGGQCADFEKGQIMTGTFTATDANIRSYGFSILPPAPASGAVVLPLASLPSGSILPQVHPLLADPGIAAGFFRLDTSPMQPCGYTLVLGVWDRTNVNSGQTSYYSQVAVGFCVRQPAQP